MNNDNVVDKIKDTIPKKHRSVVAAVMTIMAITGSILMHPITCLILFCTLLFAIVGWDPVTSQEETYKQVVVFNMAVWVVLQVLFSLSVATLRHYRNKFPKFNDAIRK